MPRPPRHRPPYSNEQYGSDVPQPPMLRRRFERVVSRSASNSSATESPGPQRNDAEVVVDHGCVFPDDVVKGEARKDGSAAPTPNPGSPPTTTPALSAAVSAPSPKSRSGETRVASGPPVVAARPRNLPWLDQSQPMPVTEDRRAQEERQRGEADERRQNEIQQAWDSVFPPTYLDINPRNLVLPVPPTVVGWVEALQRRRRGLSARLVYGIFFHMCWIAELCGEIGEKLLARWVWGEGAVPPHWHKQLTGYVSIVQEACGGALTLTVDRSQKTIGYRATAEFLGPVSKQ